uniref:SPIN-DOC-like zinc-finger domain-containing protein n=1 Tax=Pelodiscus sinensis TaxID=13735 RepID=K7G7Y3_PELSI
RVFNPVWIMEFGFVEINGKSMCLLCQKTIAVLKKTNLQWHHESCHPEFKDSYPPDSNEGYQTQQDMLRSQVKGSDAVTVASFKVAWHIELQVSNSTVVRQIESILGDLFSKLLKDIESTEYFSLAMDKSTGRSRQLMIWVRFFHGKKYVEEMLTLLLLTCQTRGEVIYSMLMAFFEEPGKCTDLNKLTSTTTDGTPSMVGKEKGLFSFLKKKPVSRFFFISLQSAANQRGFLKSTMDSVTKTISFIAANALKQTIECETQYGDLAMLAEVRWLSQSKVLDSFMDLLPAVQMFLEAKDCQDLLSCLGLLTDMTRHLNALNLKLQGKGKLPSLMCNVSAFETKLALFADQLHEKDLTHFPILNSSDTAEISFTEYISDLKTEFSSRFPDVKSLKTVLEFTENPFSVEVKAVSPSAARFGVKRATFKDEMIELQNISILKARHMDEDTEIFWMIYAHTEMCQKKVLTCFGSTCVYESSFSSTGIIKSKLRASLTTDIWSTVSMLLQ